MTVRALESPITLVAAPEGRPLEISGSISVTLDTAVTTPSITTTPLGLTEISAALPANTKRFSVRAYQGKLSLAYQTGGPYRTIGAGSVYEEKDINRPNTTLYVLSSVAGDTLEVTAWQ